MKFFCTHSYKNFTFNSFLIIVFLFVSFGELPAQKLRQISTRDHAILINVYTQKSPAPQIVLNWTKNDLSKKYEIFRKNLNDDYFPYYPIAILGQSDSVYIDNDVETGVTYEYQIRDSAVGLLTLTFVRQDGSKYDSTVPVSFRGFGYVAAGIETTEGFDYGSTLLLVDETIYQTLKSEIDIYIDDLIAEGWTVAIRTVPRAENFDGKAVVNVKKIITDEYNKSKQTLTTLILLGRVPVPYSGDLNTGNFYTDAHPDHRGAWPADLYYGVLDDWYWTDDFIRDTLPSQKKNWNIPGDGKFDQSEVPYTKVNLDVGRIDFYNMPAFPETEIELYRRYLNKNHKYRTGQLQYETRGLIGDNFGLLEGFASSAWRNFAVLCGKDNIKKAPAWTWFSTLATDSYLWSYGCGGGSWTSAGGLGDTKAKDSAGINGFVGNQVNSIFTMLFGSYFGDWDFRDNFLRAGLCSEPSILTCAWSGRPHWFLHHIAAGYPIGYSTRVSQDNAYDGLYKPNAFFFRPYDPTEPEETIYAIGFRLIHIALMGDPTLRMYSGKAAPVFNLKAVQPAGAKTVEIKWDFTLLNDTMFISQYFARIYKSKNKYGPWELINSGQKSWGNEIYYDSNLVEGENFYMVRAYIENWSASGNRIIPARGVIASTFVTSAEESNNLTLDLACNPNPITDRAVISLSLPNSSPVNLNIFDINGGIVKTLETSPLSTGSHSFSWDMSNNAGKMVAPGIYFLKADLNAISKVVKISVLK